MRLFLVPALVVLSVLSLCAGVPLAAEDSASATLRKAEALVRKLGDGSFVVREQAQEELLRLGLTGKPAIEMGTRDDDPEIRRRCLDLLPTLVEADLKQRLEAFLADKEGKKDVKLPGWDRFTKIAGSDPGARKLFAELYKADPQFIIEVEVGGDNIGGMVAGRAMTLQQNLYNRFGGAGTPPAPGEVAALLFAGAHPKCKIPLNNFYSVNNLLHHESSRAALGASDTGLAFRKLLVQWMTGQADPNASYQCLFLAMNLNLKEGIDLATKVVRDKAAQPHIRGAALVALAKLGTKDNLAEVQELFGDTGAIGAFRLGGVNNPGGSTQIRDVALATAIKLTGQNHKDYGFPFAETPNAVAYLQNPHCQGFSTDTQRDAAFKKFKDWAEANKTPR